MPAALLPPPELAPGRPDRTGLVVGGYRLLARLGGGSRGETFRAEHLTLRRPAAVKLLDRPAERRELDRLLVDVRAVAALRHPHIAAVTDAGDHPHGPAAYLVSELAAGRSLAAAVRQDGPLDPATAVGLFAGLFDALTEAHRHGLLHRRLTPDNVFLTADGRAKLLDFGVGRLPGPAAAGYAAPGDPADPRADVYGLAAVLHFAVTGFPPGAGPGVNPPELAAALGRLLAADPAARVPTAAAAARELAAVRPGRSAEYMAVVPPPPTAGHRVLLVDDEPAVRAVCRQALAGLTCDEAADGAEAVERVKVGRYDLLLLDIDLPGLNGEAVLKAVRAAPPAPHLKVVMLSGRAAGDDVARLLATGADDYLTKPFGVAQLRGRVQAALRLKDAQDRADALTRTLAAANAQLEAAVSAKADELVHARSAMVLALAKLVGRKSAEADGHLLRLQRYVRVLGEAALADPAFAGRLDPAVVALVESVAPLHDIGKVGVPDAVLNKPGPLTAAERAVMQGHTVIGADTLAGVSGRYPLFAAFFAAAVDVARSHHERWDGTGYPDGLAGEAIPLSARLVAVADVYDALRSRRVYKAGLTHAAAVELMACDGRGQFDPALMTVFERVAGQFDRVFRETED